MDIYIDIFFGINFVMDYIVLTISDLKKITKRKRILMAAFISAFISCVMIIYPYPFFFSPVFKIILLFLMTAFATFPQTLKNYLSYSICVFISSLFLLTGVFAIEIMSESFINLSFLYTPTEILLIFGITIGYLLFKFIKYSFNANKDKAFYNMQISYNGKSVKINAIKDTGNLLKSPVSSTPVIVCDRVVFEKLFAKNIEPENLREFVETKDFKIIPYKTISETGIIYGFRPHLLKIDEKTTDNIIIGFAPIKLESEALINPMIFN